MSGRMLTDAQIARALRARLPEHAQAGLLERIVADFVDVPQKRSLPSFLAGLSDADPGPRRRYQLIVATLLVVLALAVAAGVGAYLEAQKRLPAPLSLDPPTDVPAYVTRAYEGLVDLPALSMMIEEVDVGTTHMTYNGAGVLRLEDAPGPNMYRLYTDGVMAEQVDLNGEQVWLAYGGQGTPLGEIAFATGMNPGCSAEWDYVGLEYLLERPTHHVRCGASAMWLDVDIGLPLKSINAQEAVGGPTISLVVVTLDVGPQPADLFVPPPGLASMSDLEFACAQDPTCVTPPTAPPTMAPFVRPPPAAGEFAAPPDADAFVANVLAGYAALPALDMKVTYAFGELGAYRRVLHDGSGHFRMERYYDPNLPPVIEFSDSEHFFEPYGTTGDGRTLWKDWGPGDRTGLLTLGLGRDCPPGWEHRGFDLVLGRAAHHLVCGDFEAWVDREWLLVTRGQTNPGPVNNYANLDLVLELTFRQPPAELFELPEGALVCYNDRPSEDNCLDADGNEQTPSPSPSG